jgi:hypothetical protein
MLTMMAISGDRALRSNPSNDFVINLSISDVLMAFAVMIPTAISIRKYGEMGYNMYGGLGYGKWVEMITSEKGVAEEEEEEEEEEKEMEEDEDEEDEEEDEKTEKKEEEENI